MFICNHCKGVVIMEKVTIINGISDKSFNSLEGKLRERYKESFYTIRDLNIKSCCGCWNCWLKTPGECVQRDDTPMILKSIVNSDLVVFISNIRVGFITSELKTIIEKSISLVLPYIRIYNGECHHKERYNNLPDFGVVILSDNEVEEDIININREIFERLSKNFHSKVKFFAVSNGDMEVINNEIINI